MATDRPVWTATHVGRVRSANEDLYLVGKRIEADAIESWSGRLAGGHGWAVIADGMGGHDDGQIASRIVIETIAGSIESVRDESSYPTLPTRRSRRRIALLGRSHRHGPRGPNSHPAHRAPRRSGGAPHDSCDRGRGEGQHYGRRHRSEGAGRGLRVPDVRTAAWASACRLSSTVPPHRNAGWRT